MTELTPVMKQFILHWGEMGGTWGVNRTVAQIYAMLYLSPEPLTAEELSETLSIARSTVSTGLRELQGWGIVKVVHVLGDRRDHFEAVSNVWQMFRAIVSERKRREIDPTLEALRQSVAQLEDDDETQPQVRDRLREMLDFFETVTAIYDQVENMPLETLVRVAHYGDSVGKILNRLAKE